MKFSYTAVNARDKTSRGVITAASRAEAISALQEQGLLALSLVPAEGGGMPKNVWQMELTRRDCHKASIKKKRLLLIVSQFGIMMKAGVSLSLAMEVLIQGEKDSVTRAILTEMKDDLYSGTPISQSMAKFRAFPDIVVNILQSGEANGRLDTAFERCASILDREIAISSKVKGAMVYPVFLLCLTLVLVLILNVFVLPLFRDIFTQFDAELPAVTIAVMAFSDFLTQFWYIPLSAIFLFIFSFVMLYRKAPSFALTIDRFKLAVPVIGSVLHRSYIARFCRIMSSMVEAGVSIVHALEISRDVLPSLYLKDRLTQMIADVKMGASINSSMSKFPVFDSLLISMVKVGEESGMLYETMDKMAGMYEQQTEESTKQLVSVMEPAMVIIIAIVVGVTVVSIVMPMFQMYSVIA